MGRVRWLLLDVAAWPCVAAGAWAGRVVRWMNKAEFRICALRGAGVPGGGR
jgi:hypothetical protein